MPGDSCIYMHLNMNCSIWIDLTQADSRPALDLPMVETGWKIGTKWHYIVYTHCTRIETGLHAKPV